MMKSMEYPFMVKILEKGAVVPCKAHDDDVGYDVSIVGIKDFKNENLVFCKTGIVIEPHPDYYFELHARSSLCKLGFQLANSVGIIDPNYRGEVIVPLLIILPKDKRKGFLEGLEFPLRVAQLIPRRRENNLFKQPKVVDFLKETDRGQGGFGSTGK